MLPVRIVSVCVCVCVPAVLICRCSHIKQIMEHYGESKHNITELRCVTTAALKDRLCNVMKAISLLANLRANRH